MALVDPYAPCHCGSGQKYKWCCQSVETYVERSQRLLDNGQYELAINPLLEGLAKVPDNVSLLLRKALVQLHLNQTESASETLRLLASETPGASGRFDLDDPAGPRYRGRSGGRGPVSAGAFGAEPSDRSKLASLASFLGSTLARAEYPAAAIKHLELAAELSGDEAKRVASHLQNLRANPAVSVWEKNPYRLWPAPEQATAAFRESFERAAGLGRRRALVIGCLGLRVAGGGLGRRRDRRPQSRAVLPVARGPRGGRCRVQAIHRPHQTDDRLGRPGSSLPENRAPVALRPRRFRSIELADPEPRRIAGRAAAPIERSPGMTVGRSILKVDTIRSASAREFPAARSSRVEARPGLSRLDLPLVEGEVLVDKDVVYLEALDDGRLDRLIDRFTSGCGLEYSAGSSPDQGHRPRSPGTNWPWSGDGTSRPGSLKRRVNASNASRLPISFPRSGPRRPTRRCAVVRRFRLVRPVIPKHSCAQSIRRMEVFVRPARGAASTGTSCAQSFT